MQDSYLTYFLTELAGTTAMIFTRTCDNTRMLALMLRNLGIDALPIHGQMSQPKRLGALNTFKGGDRSILLATGEQPLSAGWSVIGQYMHTTWIQKSFLVADAARLELPCSARS